MTGRAAPHLPLVVLPDHDEVRRPPHLTPAARRCLEVAVRSLDGLGQTLQGATGRSGRLDDAMEAATDAVGELLAALPEIPLTQVADVVPTVPVHGYFGVRTASLTPGQNATQAAEIMFRVLADLGHVLLDVNDLETEVVAMRCLLASLAGGPPTGQAGERVEPRPAGPRPSPSRPAGDGLDRWIVVHHLYFLLNLHAAAAVREAARAILAGSSVACGLLGEATTCVRGFTATMMHSGAVSATYYRDVLRPTMQPPAAPVLLTGLMQPEHASYRAAIDELLEASPEPFLVLVRRDRDLAFARDALLEADLLDIERHTSVAAALVGADRSIVQHEQAPDNAISTLRRMRHRRAARYRDLMRFGDRAVEVDVAGSVRQ